jgi:hypothetical protein
LLEAKVLVERGWPGGRLNTNLNTGTYRGGRSMARDEDRTSIQPQRDEEYVWAGVVAAVAGEWNGR